MSGIIIVEHKIFGKFMIIIWLVYFLRDKYSPVSVKMICFFLSVSSHGYCTIMRYFGAVCKFDLTYMVFKNMKIKNTRYIKLTKNNNIMWEIIVKCVAMGLNIVSLADLLQSRKHLNISFSYICQLSLLYEIRCTRSDHNGRMVMCTFSYICDK